MLRPILVSIAVATFSLGFGVSSASAEKMYWTRFDPSDGGIQRADLDGSNVEGILTGLIWPERIALDLNAGKLYWTGGEGLGGGNIQRARLDGSNAEEVLTGLDGPTGIALDLSAGKMYWSQLNPARIRRADLDGSNIEDLVTGSLAEGIALDLAAGKMYWTRTEYGEIARADLDGSNIEVLVSGLENTTDIALDPDAGKMYWTEHFYDAKIQRANLDGSNIEELVTAGLDFPTGIALDRDAGKMYWTDPNTHKIQRANLDGSNVEDLISGLTSPWGIALDLRPAEVSPITLDFGIVPVGNYLDKTFTITNTGEEPLSGTVSEACDHYSLISGGGPYTLQSAESLVVTVRFEPYSTGQHDCTIETGNAICDDVFSTGLGEGTPPCGDAQITGDEECDDGGTTPGDGCDETCQIEHGWECNGEPSVCVEVCGNGLVSTSEGCDDGGTTPGDGCDETCQVEAGWICLGEPSVCSFCGDGLVEGSEGCDDGGTTPGDGCDETCQIEHGWECSGEPSVCVEVCGNGLVSTSEECDDGGTTPGDGCDASCQVEAGWICLGEPSVCSFCGDGLVEGSEGCDDGGTTPGDGCDASCQVETGWICVLEPSVCTLLPAKGAAYPITGNMRFQIGEELPIPIGGTPAPEGKIYAEPHAAIIQESAGPDPRTITIPDRVFHHPGAPPCLVPVYGANHNIWQILTAINVTIPMPPMRPGDVLLNVLQESGRTGPPTVTWCPGQPIPNATFNPSCTAPGAGPIANIPGIIRYRKTENQFGGPISSRFGGLVDLALRLGGAPPPCNFATTTCQAFFAIGPPPQTGVNGGPWGRWTKTTAPPPVPGQFNIVANPGGTIVYITPMGIGPGKSNSVSSWGGPWTTGQILNTVGTPFATYYERFTRTGSDNRVSGVGTISLIAGAVSNRALTGPNANRGWLNITVPEPAAAVGATAAFLLLAACHSLVRRRSR